MNKQLLFKIPGAIALAVTGVFILIVEDANMPIDHLSPTDLALSMFACGLILMSCGIFATMVEE